MQVETSVHVVPVPMCSCFRYFRPSRECQALQAEAYLMKYATVCTRTNQHGAQVQPQRRSALASHVIGCRTRHDAGEDGHSLWALVILGLGHFPHAHAGVHVDNALVQSDAGSEAGKSD